MRSQTSIIDEFPPYVWSSCGDWIKAFGECNDKSGIGDADAKIGAPWSVDVEGDRAYAVCPATYTYKRVARRLHGGVEEDGRGLEDERLELGKALGFSHFSQ